MAECPQCHSSVDIPEGAYGTLFTCPNCQAVYFVGWDGVPESPQPTDIQLAHQMNAPPPIESPSFFENPGLESSSVQTNSPIEVSAPLETPLASATQEAEMGNSLFVDGSANFQDVVDFGNSAPTAGTLTYTVTIHGIEIADIREKFKEAVTDSRFAWDVDQIMLQITNGSLVLADLSPAKAVVLINRIKYLPIRVTWRQNVLQ